MLIPPISYTLNTAHFQSSSQMVIFHFDHYNSHLISLSVSPLTPPILLHFLKTICWYETVITLLPYLGLQQLTMTGFISPHLWHCPASPPALATEHLHSLSWASRVQKQRLFLFSWSSRHLKQCCLVNQNWTSVVVYVIYSSCILTVIFINTALWGSWFLFIFLVPYLRTNRQPAAYMECFV